MENWTDEHSLVQEAYNSYLAIVEDITYSRVFGHLCKLMVARNKFTIGTASLQLSP